jgi:GT2 family glycosyltransferase
MAPREKIVDVIIPVHNQFEIVKNCIESVIKTLPLNCFEIIVVDDASTDQQLKKYLDITGRHGVIKVFSNPNNLGFTRSVNFGMGLHPDRDVLLLNSDTVVYGTWLERLRAAAYSDEKVATANPLTNASHISNYPYRENNDGLVLEVADDVLDNLAAEKNWKQYIDVHTTFGFCMFIKRECINSIGRFDARNFPIGYGEESDFCYRAREVGWRHVVTGDTFVRHFENQSFGPRKEKLMREMIKKFVALHPDCPQIDQRFKKVDPLRRLRSNLDMARLRRLVAGQDYLPMRIVHGSEILWEHSNAVLVYSLHEKDIKLQVENKYILPNLERYVMPRDMLNFNSAMKYLGVEQIRLSCSPEELSLFQGQISALPPEIKWEPHLELLELQ